jgi:hypothetical protein
MDGTGAVDQIVGVLHQMAGMVKLGAIHAAIRTLGIFLQLVFQRIGVFRRLRDELVGRALAFALGGGVRGQSPPLRQRPGVV